MKVEPRTENPLVRFGRYQEEYMAAFDRGFLKAKRDLEWEAFVRYVERTRRKR